METHLNLSALMYGILASLMSKTLEMTTLVKKERRELWLKISPWNVRLFFSYQPVVRCSMGQLEIGGIPPYWHQSGSKFSPLRRENWPVRKLEAASNPFVPHSSLGRQWLKGWDIGRCKIRRRTFLMRHGQNVKANQLWSPEELRHVARAGVEARIFSCYSRMMLRTTTLIHTTVPGHSFIPSSSFGWYYL